MEIIDILAAWVMIFMIVVVEDNTPCIGDYWDAKKCFLAFSALVLGAAFMLYLGKLLFGV